MNNLMVDTTRQFHAALEEAAALSLKFIRGTPGPDNIIGTSANERIYGGSGNDRIMAKGGDDRVFGEAGNDQIDLGWGFDYANGGLGDDTIRLVADSKPGALDKVNVDTDIVIITNDDDGKLDTVVFANFAFNGPGQRTGHAIVESEKGLKWSNVGDDRAFATVYEDGKAETKILFYWDSGFIPTPMQLDTWIIGVAG